MMKEFQRANVWRSMVGNRLGNPHGPSRFWRTQRCVWLAVCVLRGGLSDPFSPPVAAATADPFSRARQQMVADQLSGYGRDIITNASVLKCMGKVPRHEFVPEEFRADAYRDTALPIGYGQTISQPYIVAFMTQSLEPKPNHRVLEVGTGSGYQAAVLSCLVAQVYTIEIVDALAKRAAADLKRLGYTNVMVRAGDGYKGWPEAAPFDAISVTCAPENIPQPLVDQLKDGGRMIIPVGTFARQYLWLLVKHGNKLERQAVLPVRFVPMTGEAGSGTNRPAAAESFAPTERGTNR